MWICLCVCGLFFKCLCLHVYISVCASVHVFFCVYLSKSSCVCVFFYVCVCTCVSSSVTSTVMTSLLKVDVEDTKPQIQMHFCTQVSTVTKSQVPSLLFKKYLRLQRTFDVKLWSEASINRTMEPLTRRKNSKEYLTEQLCICCGEKANFWVCVSIFLS